MQPIFIAIIQNDIPAFLGLVEERELWLEVRNVEQDNSTVLHMAANHGHGELVSKIIELKRSLIFSRNAHGNTPLHLAALLGDVNTVRTLLEFGSETCSQNNNYQTPLHLVCRSISTEAARIFAEKTRFVSLDELKFALSSGSTFMLGYLYQKELY
ncbi:BnaCnng53460D [Brassica napus]|uniref:BnaCnng53460D protein n=2 Tax=Brassica TaxID=3705 RepID=A0A078JKW8_BRANA|nr:BnaCnng53460D [Brassica napus]